jgi:hypothetical protein
MEIIDSIGVEVVNVLARRPSMPSRATVNISSSPHCEVPRRLLGTLLADLSAPGLGAAATEQEAEEELRH